MNATAPMCVFVVDDDLDSTECMRLLLKHWGHNVHVANQGRVAIEQAPFVKPDLMLVDLAMPEVDGLTVARQVRQAPVLASTALVALTGYADPKHREQAFEAGFDECLVKPLPADELQKLLARVRSRIDATRKRTSQAMEAAAASRELTEKEKSRRRLEDQAAKMALMPTDPAPVFIRLQKSGISDMIVLEDWELAEQLRQWLRDRGCRVGPVFEPAAGEVAFFCYSRRQARTLLAAHPKVRIGD